ncbi:hematopoietic SH2 domain-containing protein-like [Carcharodon carcharias]|uniref:hematopoietic SH2 domain-containing protein-like n=1 Tax=Carcharodon carcharias TaxID=13397 RepID=UPI001B7EA90B|nr:hematopoietic SH2 domain-containing protein-like [Carcharodon carcharias]
MDASNAALTRKAAVTWFTTTQALKIMRDGTVPDWFHGIISRREAEQLLKDKALGCFLIRVGESRIGFSLSYRGLDRCRHFIIDVTTGGQYNIAGESNFHSALQDLVNFHTHVPIAPFNECLTSPCGQVSHRDVDYEELGIFVPMEKNWNSPTSCSDSSAGSSYPAKPKSVCHHGTPNQPKEAASGPPIPLKGGSNNVPPSLPCRGVTSLKPMSETKAMIDELPELQDRASVKRLYPSLRNQPTAISMEQLPTAGATASGAQNLLLQRNQHNSETRIWNSSSGPDVSDSKSEFKHQADGNVSGSHPIPIQRQQTDHVTDTNIFAPTPKYIDNSPSIGNHYDLLFPAHHNPRHPPRATRKSVSPGQSILHRPTLCSLCLGQEEPVGGCQLVTGCAEGEGRGQASGIVALPEEYMTPPPYAPGY